jgi:two-component system, chemotaxis family, sensor kinase CheA
MTPLLQQFISEARDFLQSISENLLKLEKAPRDADLMSDLFRSVHTLKGNSGMFDFPEMSRVLHAAEDLMSVVRDGLLTFDQELADRLLDAMDFVGLLLDETQAGAGGAAAHAQDSVNLAAALRELIVVAQGVAAGPPEPVSSSAPSAAVSLPLDAVPHALRAAWREAARADAPLDWIVYTPASDCFYKGEDPFHQARQTPEIVWQRVGTPEVWPPLDELDPYQCVLRFDLVTDAPRAALDEHFRYVPEQVAIVSLTLQVLDPAPIAGAAAHGVGADDAAANDVVIHVAPANGIAARFADAILAAQVTALGLPDSVTWLPGRLRAIASTLTACYRSSCRDDLLPSLDAALAVALSLNSAAPLKEWMSAQGSFSGVAADSDQAAPINPMRPIDASNTRGGSQVTKAVAPLNLSDAPVGRSTEEAPSPTAVLKVDQEKVDRLMSLIGEMVVAKNGLPFLAARAETAYGVRELSREIKAQYAVINRIAEEMQDAIMQVRMMPVSGVFQRFPRLVRDISRKLGKEVLLTLEGEETEADKNIIEALAEPLIHIVRNSLDHGIETPDARRAAGKAVEGRLLIRASQDSGRVLIDISDDGKGIDPAAIKRKAYEKGIIDEADLERITDQEAINLVFAAGFSTAETVSDLSGRGVGMDVVRNAVERVNGSVALTSEVGRGTRLRLSLPLSMAVTNVMVIESNKQIFGVPMDMVLETVRIPRSAIRSIKNRQTIVLRNRVLPLRSLNELLAGDLPQVSNELDEMATLVVQIHGESLGIVVDDFREVVDIILKPMGGILNAVSGYSGSALLGDGSVLMVLNPKELVTWQ